MTSIGLGDPAKEIAATNIAELSQTFQAPREHYNALPPVLLRNGGTGSRKTSAQPFFMGKVGSSALGKLAQSKQDPIKNLLDKIRRSKQEALSKDKKFELEELVRSRLGDDLKNFPFAQQVAPSIKTQFSKSPMAVYSMHQKSLKKLHKQDSKFSFASRAKKGSAGLPEIAGDDQLSKFSKLNVDTDIEFQELNIERRDSSHPPNYNSTKRFASKTPINRKLPPGIQELAQNRSHSDTPTKMLSSDKESLVGKKKTLKIYIYDGQNSHERSKEKLPQENSIEALNTQIVTMEPEPECAKEDRLRQDYEELEETPGFRKSRGSIKKTITSKISRRASHIPQSYQYKYDSYESYTIDIQRELELSGVLGVQMTDEGPNSLQPTARRKKIVPLIRSGRSNSSRPSRGQTQRYPRGQLSDRGGSRVIYSERRDDPACGYDGLSDEEVGPSPMESRFSSTKGGKRSGKRKK